MRIILTFLAFISVLSLSAQKNDGDFHLDKEYNLNATGTINLSCSDAKVYVTGTSRKTAHLKIDREVRTRGLFFGSEEFAIDVDNSGGDLRVRERSHSVNSGIVGYYHEEYTINIEAPEGTSLVIKGDDGDYRIQNINGSISISVDDADVELTACKGNNFRFKLDDGDLTMDGGTGSIDVDTDDGDINIRNAHFTKVIADIDDGDLEIETSLADNGEYKIDAQDGLVSLTILGGGGEFNIKHDDGRIIADDGFEIREKTESFTKALLARGSARVDIHADDARVRLYKH